MRLVTSSTVTGRWVEAAERGLGLLAARLDADVQRVRAEESASRHRVLDGLGREGIDLIFCVGPGFERAVFTEAPVWPETTFVLLLSRARGDNVASIRFFPEGAGYVAGKVAAALAVDAEVGVLRGAGGEWLEGLETGFVRGVRSARRGVAPPVAQGAEGPWQLRDAGVRVALYAADEADPETLAAAHDAGLYLVASYARLLDSEPDVVVAAIDVAVAEAMLRVATEVVDGTFRGQVYGFDLGSGVLDVRLNRTMPTARLPTVQEALDTGRTEVTAGYVEVEQLGM